MAEPAAAAPKRFPWLALILAGVAFAVLIGLGTWQVERLKWKETLLATIDERIHSKPVPLAQLVKLFAETEDVDYWPVTATGVFDHAREQHFFATHDGAAGYFVYTPLVQDRGETILVNRGFVPFDFKDPATRIEGQTEGPVTVTGLARNPLDGKPSSLVPNNDAAKNIYYWKDITLMAKQSGSSGGKAGSVLRRCRCDAKRRRSTARAASRSSTCPTITSSMQLPGTGLQRRLQVCWASGFGGDHKQCDAARP